MYYFGKLNILDISFPSTVFCFICGALFESAYIQGNAVLPTFVANLNEYFINNSVLLSLSDGSLAVLF